MTLVAFFAVFSYPLPTLLAAMASTEWHSGAQGYGLYTALLAAGAFSGALLSTRRSSLRLRTIIFSALGFGILQAALGFAPFVLRIRRAVGAGRRHPPDVWHRGETMVQLSSNLMIRGRVMALFSLIIVGGQAVGGPAHGLARADSSVPGPRW